MEKRQYRDNYLPFAAARLENGCEFLENLLKPAGSYRNLNDSQRALTFLLSKVLKSYQNWLGPLFHLEKGVSNYSIPSKWLPIVNYLLEKGLMKDICFRQVYNDEPKIVKIGTSSVTDISDLTDGFSHSFNSLGTSFDVDEALSKAIGEFLERFMFLIYREKDLIRVSLADLKKKGKFHLDIKDLAGFSGKQKENFSRFRFDEQSEFFWAEGKSLIDGKKCLIPAQLIFWNYIFPHKDWQEPVLREPNTNGAGGNFSLKKAILSGLYELIERDGFLIYWLNKKAPPQIDLETIYCEPLKKLIGEYRRLGFEVHFYDTTTDLEIPSCLCSVFDHTGIGSKISVGAGSSFDWDKALLTSLTEAGGGWSWFRTRKEEGEKWKGLPKDYEPFRDEKMGQIERLNLWGSEKMFKNFQFFLKGKIQSLITLKTKTPKFSSSDEEMNHLIKKFKSLGKGYEIFYYDAKNKILKDLDYFTVQVIVPALLPLYLRESYAPLGTRRLKEAPGKMGFEPAKEWNPLPHPFP
jgi:ribosomal protein S12 methylthiotransferase accessory factor